MKRYLILILKGFIIGIGKILPGISGAFLAIILKVYDKGLNAIIHFNKNAKENIYILSSLMIGIILSIIIFSKILTLLIKKSEFLVMIFFIGLILGTVKNITKEIKNNNYIIIIVTIILFTGIMFMSGEKIYIMKYNYKDYITFFCGGLLEAIGTVVPGVSSTALLLLMGIYQIIISLFANITNLEIVMNSFNIILPFLFGLILGIYIVSLLISKLFCHYKNTTYNIILGIFISTIISLTYQTLTKLSTTHELIIGIPLLLVGYTVGKAFDR